MTRRIVLTPAAMKAEAFASAHPVTGDGGAQFIMDAAMKAEAFASAHLKGFSPRNRSKKAAMKAEAFASAHVHSA